MATSGREGQQEVTAEDAECKASDCEADIHHHATDMEDLDMRGADMSDAVLPQAVLPQAAAGNHRSSCSKGSRTSNHRALLVGIICSLLGTACCATLCVHLVSAIQEKIRRSTSCPGAGAAQSWLLESTSAYADPSPLPRIRGPEMYGKVREKTIWAYWYHKKDCPTSKSCVLPPALQLCTETVRKNRGGFDYKIIHKDEVLRYVTQMELPLRFMQMLPAQQKDALMNALLARYGGVALDISTVLFRPLDEHWEEMVSKGATFSGYMYRITGMRWANAETLAVWFLMSRREGIFSTAVRSQIINMGNHKHPQKAHLGGFHNPYFAMGDQTLLPILSMFNYSFPSCLKDPTVKSDSWIGGCPELEFQHPTEEMPGPARNDAKLILREPQLGPQLPFAFADNFSMPVWHVHSTRSVNVSALPGVPTCATMKECWDDVFLPRYNSPERLLNSIKLFNSGGSMKYMTREQILSDHGTFFYNWLKLAGVVEA